MTNIHSDSRNGTTFVDPVLAGVERQIFELRQTIAELAADGHEVQDATKHLNSLIASLRIRKSTPSPW
jgi:hypothetical protein